jgi:hypothetical protein
MKRGFLMVALFAAAWLVMSAGQGWSQFGPKGGRGGKGGGGKGGDARASIEQELEKLKARIKELEGQLRGKGAPEKGKGFGRFDPEKMKEMMKKFGEGKFDPAKAKDWKKKFEGKRPDFAGKPPFGKRPFEGKPPFAKDKGKDMKKGPPGFGDKKGPREDRGGASADVRRALDDIQRGLDALRKALEKR